MFANHCVSFHGGNITFPESVENGPSPKGIPTLFKDKEERIS